MKILILCTGNSCRSQMAHGFLQSFDSRIMVRSAGTQIAKKINPMAVASMKNAGIDISSHKPILVDEYLNEDWDYLITVCDHANESCPAFYGKVKTRFHFGFQDPSLATGTDEFIRNEFIRTRDLIKEKFEKFYIEYLKGKV